ncbi:MAG: LPS export ABC transporter periplasmic protein LptC [Spirochaetaceae bacterium]|jgi:LPS export ABC transporter protein LptC|nr:LPS export ABC transporter periplasmic protein LptC [Spirochaetaceae bacterium]
MNKRRFNIMMSFLFVFAVLAAGCSFDYGNQEVEESALPDIVMVHLDYVRVRGGSPQARFIAERAERYDKRRTMELSVIQFEQYNLATGELDVKGTAGGAEVELGTGNVTLKNGIDLSVESEEITMETDWLAWNDGERTLKGREDAVVVIKQSGGTDFNGTGLSANVRSRQWEFSGGAEGAFEQDDDEEEGEEDSGAAEGENGDNGDNSDKEGIEN